jgi:hypothetical protein
MDGLTGGSWKRSRDRATATATEKNNPTGNRVVTNGSVPYRRSTPLRQLSTLHTECDDTRSEYTEVPVLQGKIGFATVRISLSRKALPR